MEKKGNGDSARLSAAVLKDFLARVPLEEIKQRYEIDQNKFEDILRTVVRKMLRLRSSRDSN